MSENAHIKIGYRNPPKDTQFKPGNTQSPRQRAKTEESISDGILRRIREPVKDPKRPKRRTTRLELAARAMAERAANGDRKALVDIIRLRKVPEHMKPSHRRLSFWEAVEDRYYGPYRLTEEFYKKQDEQKKEFRRQVQEETRFGEVLDKVLRSRGYVEREGRKVRVSMQDVIVHNMSNEVAKGDAALITLLEKVNNRKTGFRGPRFTEVAKPNAEQAEWLARHVAEGRRKDREAWNEEFPDRPLAEGEVVDWSKA